MISDYPESDFLNKAIFEASELLGQLDQSDQQMALLESLSESKGNMEKKPGKTGILSNDLVLHLFCCRFRIKILKF